MPGRPRRQLPGGFRQGAPTTVAHVNLPYELTMALEPHLDDSEVSTALGDGKNVYLSDLIRGGALLLHALLKTRTRSRVLRFLNLPFPQQEQLALAQLAFRYGLAEAPPPPGADSLMPGATAWRGDELIRIDQDIREGYRLSMIEAGFEDAPSDEAPIDDPEPWTGNSLLGILHLVEQDLQAIVESDVAGVEAAQHAIAGRQRLRHLLKRIKASNQPAPAES